MYKSFEDAKKNLIKIYGKDPSTMDELAECCIAVINSQVNKCWHTKEKAPPENLIVWGFSWNLIKVQQVSNSHSCPIMGKTNWGGRVEDAPRNYPGWQGRVWIRYRNEPASFMASDAFNQTYTHTGTGGGGNYDGPWTAVYYTHNKPRPAMFNSPHLYSWDYKIFDADWPLIDPYPDINLLEVIQTNVIKQPTHKFLWNHPDAIAHDEEVRSLYTAYEVGVNNSW